MTPLRWWVLFAILHGWVAAVAADARDRSAISWFLLGGLLGPFAIAAVLVMERRGVTCRVCGEVIRTSATRCRYCGTEVTGG